MNKLKLQWRKLVSRNTKTIKHFGRGVQQISRFVKRLYFYLQCCHGGGEGSKVLHYKIIYDELEICFKSLMVYLDNKRRAFPRFYFVSDPILLSILSRPADMESVRPHLR